jgi:hypothetical protein
VSELFDDFTWYTWTLLGLLALALLLVLLAGVGLKGDASLGPRPLPLPKERPDQFPPPAKEAASPRYAPQHSRIAQRVVPNRPPQTLADLPPRQELHWLGSDQTSGWWIWQEAS